MLKRVASFCRRWFAQAFGSSRDHSGSRVDVQTNHRESLGRHFFHRKAKTAATVAVPFLQPYNPKNVGNDASARPWESPESFRWQSGTLPPAVSTAQAAQDVSIWGAQPVVKGLEDLAHKDLPQAWREGLPLAPQVWSRFDTQASKVQSDGVSTAGHGQHGWPFGFEVCDFLAMAQQHFLSLQEAWDRRDLGHMQDFLSPTMLQEVKDQFSQLALSDDNAASSPKAQDMSEVLMLDSQCLSVKFEGLEQKVSVELSGMIREGHSASPNPFREIWTWSKTVLPHHEQDLQGWRVSALEALQ